MKRQDIITNILDNMSDIKRAIFPTFLHLEKHKPTLSQTGVMMIVSHAGESTIKDIAELLKISPSAATQLADGLTEKKLLMRNPDTNDKRKINLKLTKEGEKILREMKEEQMKFLTKVFDTLNDAELKQMDGLQKKVLAHIKI